MDDKGFIVIYRSMKKWEWYQDTNTKVVFLHLLLNANWEDGNFKGHVIPRGSLVVGRKKLAKELGLSEQSIRTALEHLKLTNEITIKTTNKFSVVTIVNWEKYQYKEEELTNNQPTTNHQINHQINQQSNQQSNQRELLQTVGLEDITNQQSNQQNSQQKDQQLTTIEQYNNKTIYEKSNTNVLQEKKEKPRRNIIPPKLEWVKEYCQERKNNVDAEKFFDFYESKGWKVGKERMKDWEASVRTWEKDQKAETKSGYDLYRETKRSNYDFEALERETKTPLKGYTDYNDLDAWEREVRAIHK